MTPKISILYNISVRVWCLNEEDKECHMSSPVTFTSFQCSLSFQEHYKFTITVSDAVKQNAWAIRGQRSRHYHELYTAITAVNVPDPQDRRDVILWKAGDDDYQESFLSTKTWEQIRGKKEKVRWSKVVWFAQGVPRFSFITWLAIKNRFSTGDRMRSWGMIQGCLLCGEVNETRDHLFFVCPYSFTVWHDLANRIIGAHIDPDWQLTLEYMEENRVSTMDGILIKMLFQTTIYHLWRERAQCEEASH